MFNLKKKYFNLLLGISICLKQKCTSKLSLSQKNPTMGFVFDLNYLSSDLINKICIFKIMSYVRFLIFF